MSIRTKTIVVVAATLVVLISALYISLGNVLMSGFRTVEGEDTRKNVMRASDAIKADLAGIQNSLFTWTQWDPAYQYVTDRNKQFYDENISATLFTGMKINFCVFVDPRFEFPYAGGYDLEGQRDIPVPGDLLKALNPRSVLLQNKDTNKAVTGILNLAGGPLLVAAAPLTDTKGTAPARGYLVFAKFLDAAEIRRLAQTTHLAIKLDTRLRPIDQIAVVIRNEAYIDGVTVLRDVYDKPALVMTVEMPRAIYREGIRSLQYLLAAILAIGVVFGIVIMILLETIVLRRVVRLSAAVTNRTQTLDFTTIPVEGRDEISRLTTSINGMICAVSEFLSHPQAAAGK